MTYYNLPHGPTKTRVVTFDSPLTGRVSLCDEHETLAASDAQVYFGQHRGGCDECQKIRTAACGCKEGCHDCA